MKVLKSDALIFVCPYEILFPTNLRFATESLSSCNCSRAALNFARTMASEAVVGPSIARKPTLAQDSCTWLDF